MRCVTAVFRLWGMNQQTASSTDCWISEILNVTRHLLALPTRERIQKDVVFIWSHVLRNVDQVSVWTVSSIFWELHGTFPIVTDAYLDLSWGAWSHCLISCLLQMGSAAYITNISLEDDAYEIGNGWIQKQFGNGFFALIADANPRIYRYDLIRHNWNKKFKIGGNCTELKGTLEPSLDGPQHQRNASCEGVRWIQALIAKEGN